MPAISIRRLEPSDADDYRTIRLDALQRDPEAFGSIYSVEADFPLVAIADRLASSVVFGAYADGQIVGMVGLKQETGPKTSHKGFVFGLYVHPDWRGQSIGSRLVEALIASARDIVEQLTLSVVHDNNAAISLYQKLGFAVYGVEPRALKSTKGYSDEVLMALILPPD
ncbi:GNAT family N-acetyltransferase [Microvirga massiliensis]|uniref:GNAT family N-acetyltransferase n=1 Tax=Microvirga massiliensis TaxID=1033741 RepID=UPI00062B4051|nr:GNAT family N-acetyltransferase [Microvirga massiliensis]